MLLFELEEHLLQIIKLLLIDKFLILLLVKNHYIFYLNLKKINIFQIFLMNNFPLFEIIYNINISVYINKQSCNNTIIIKENQYIIQSNFVIQILF